MSVFADPEAIVAELINDRLMAVARRYWPGVELSEPYILGQLQVAERAVESDLHCFLEPVEVLPYGATQAERDAFDNAVDDAEPPKPAPRRWVEEPGYDLTPEFWRPDNYGFTVLRHAPVIAVHSVRLVYPRPAATVWDVPEDWFRIDKKPGYLRLFPTGGAMLAPLAGYLGPMMLAGATIPQMIQVRYVSGLTNCARDWPQILDLIKKTSVMTILMDQFLPQSGSQSIERPEPVVWHGHGQVCGQPEAAYRRPARTAEGHPGALGCSTASPSMRNSTTWDKAACGCRPWPAPAAMSTPGPRIPSAECAPGKASSGSIPFPAPSP